MHLIDEIDDVVLECPIPANKYALIIGSKGATIKRLSADHNVRIYVPDFKDKSNSNQCVQLEGEFQNVLK